VWENAGVSERRFRARVVRKGKGGLVVVPFDPDEAWGKRERHHITGSIGGFKIRGALKGRDLPLGPAWMRDNPVPDEVEVVLEPEGPQADALAEDIASALAAAPGAKEFFASMPTFYRKNFLRWIDSAKREETRAKRISEMISLLKKGERERG
jgi:hypothetical protein